MKQKRPIQAALVHLLGEGSISLPISLFTEYKRMSLSEKEVMLLIHLMVFREKAQKFFPTVSELSERMSMTSEEIMGLLQNLVRGGFLTIEEEVNKEGLRCERYCTNPLLHQVISSYLDRENETNMLSSKKDEYQSLFSTFENEFGRPLSPLECEALSQWVDEDGYDQKLIETALREAVYSGKVNFRYIDRILLEWQRNQVRTTEDAEEYSRNFRKKGVLYQTTKVDSKTRECVVNDFSFYNWMNQK